MTSWILNVGIPLALTLVVMGFMAYQTVKAIRFHRKVGAWIAVREKEQSELLKICQDPESTSKQKVDCVVRLTEMLKESPPHA